MRRRVRRVNGASWRLYGSLASHKKRGAGRGMRLGFEFDPRCAPKSSQDGEGGGGARARHVAVAQSQYFRALRFIGAKMPRALPVNGDILGLLRAAADAMPPACAPDPSELALALEQGGVRGICDFDGLSSSDLMAIWPVLLGPLGFADQVVASVRVLKKRKLAVVAGRAPVRVFLPPL